MSWIRFRQASDRCKRFLESGDFTNANQTRDWLTQRNLIHVTLLHKKWRFPLRIALVNATKSVSSGFGLIN